MSSVLVIRIPGWRSFAIHLPSAQQLVHDVARFFRRKHRPRIFTEIELGNDQAALQHATPAKLASLRGEWGESPLIAAINCGRSELACHLLQIGGTKPNDGSLATAAMSGDLLVVKALLSHGKDPNEPLPSEQSLGMTPLMWATNRKFVTVMEALLNAGARVNAVADDGTTAAMFARDDQTDDLQALELLCQYKPDITIKDWRGRNVVQEAIDRERFGGKPEMLILLQKHYPEVDFRGAN